MNDAIAKRVKELRLSKNMTQDELAERLHVTRQAVSNWEMGKTAVSVEYLTELAEIFGVTIEELISGKTPAVAYEKRQRKYVASSVACGAVLVVSLILYIVLGPVLADIRAKYFALWPAIAYNGIWTLIFFAAGGLLPSLVSLKADIRLYGWKRHLALGLAAFCLLLLIFPFTAGFLPFADGLRWLYLAMLSSMKLVSTVLPLLIGLGAFLGLNR